MADSADKLNEEKVSWIITSSCQLLRKSFSSVSDHMHELMMATKLGPKAYTILCGSMAEFYIRPLNKCVTDSDFIYSETEELAFCDEVSVLPSDMSGLADTIICHKIEPCER